MTDNLVRVIEPTFSNVSFQINYLKLVRTSVRYPVVILTSIIKDKFCPTFTHVTVKLPILRTDAPKSVVE